MSHKSLLLLALVLLPLPALRADDAEGGPRTYKIAPSTQIQLDAADATVDQLKAGFEADVTDDALQPGTAAMIDAHTPSAKGGEPPKSTKAPATPAAPKTGKTAPTPPPSPKHWTITAVSAASITIAYK